MALKILKYILKQLSKLMIWRYRPEIIVITGSVGKTSAKEAIYTVLSLSKKRVRRSMENLNNELGVMLTILGNWPESELKLVIHGQSVGEKKIKKYFFWLKVILISFIRLIFFPKFTYSEILILEFGADRPGDIKKLLEIIKPKIGIVTAIGNMPSHIEFYNGIEAVAKEELRIIEQMSVNDFAILNFDDKMVMEIKERARAKFTTFGFDFIEVDKDRFSDIRYELTPDIKIINFENYFEVDKLVGVHFKIEYNGNIIPVTIKNVFGKPSAYAAGAAICVGLIYNLNLVKICEALSSNYQPAKHRMNLISGIKNSLVIDDSYNASPDSMKVALETLADLKTKKEAKKIAILGDMLELGEYSLKAHKLIGKLVSGIVDFLITVGPSGKIIAEVANFNGLAEDKILSFDMTEEAGKAVKQIIKKGDIILVKASRGIGLDKVVEQITAHSSSG